MADPMVIEAGQVYCREATATVESVDADQGLIDVRIVPYEVEGTVADGLSEVFTRGAFAGAVGNPSRCKVSDQQHQRDVIVGRAVALRDEDDALYGTLRIADTSAGRDLLTLLRGPDPVLDQMSVEFRALAGKYEVTRRGPGDILVRHRRAELVGVSPVSIGAYGEAARVIAVRSAAQSRARESALALLDTLTAGSSHATR